MKILEDLEEVVRLWGAAEEAKVYGTDGEFYVADKAYADKTAIYIATHHATIRDMAKRLLEIQAENSMLRAGLEAAERDTTVWRCTRSYPTGDGGRHYSEEFAKTKADMLIYKAKGYHCEILVDYAMQETGR